MPQLMALLPVILSASGAISGALGIGKSIYDVQDYKGPDTNQATLDAKNADAQSAQQAAGLEAQKTALLRRAAPDAQAATGGSLAPDSFAAFTSMLAGMPGDNQLASRVLGSGNTGGLTSPSSSPSMAAMGQPSSPISGGESSGMGREPGGMMEMIMNLFNGSGNGNGNGSVAGGGDSSGGFGMEDARNSFAYGY